MAPLTELSQHGAVRIVTLNRPDKRNVLSLELLEALAADLRAASDDDATSVVVVRGAGKGFSAGVDLSGAGRSESISADRERMRRTYQFLEDVFQCPLPVVAAVHGFALGGGADLALHCDFLIVADDAKIGHPAVRDVGVPPTNMWVYRLGPQLAKRLLLTGDRISGAEAARLGLALYSCPEVSLEGVAHRFAQRLAKVGRECLVGNKFVINRSLDLMGRPALNRVAEAEDAITHTSPTATSFFNRAREAGAASAVRERDARFDPEPQRVSGEWDEVYTSWGPASLD